MMKALTLSVIIPHRDALPRIFRCRFIQHAKRGAGVHCALSGAAGMSMAHTLGFGVNIANPIHLPSGDHEMSPGSLSTRVICDVAPSAFIQRTYT